MTLLPPRPASACAYALGLALAVLAAVSGCTPARSLAGGARAPFPLYLGTNDTSAAGGIFRAALADGGALTAWTRVGEAAQPTFLAWSPDSSYLLAVEELPEGRVASFGVHADTLLRVGTRATGGGAPCHVAVSGNGLVAVSNYSGGNVGLWRIAADGALSERLDLHDHRSAPDDTAHAHSAYFVAGDREVIAADLGRDAVFRYDVGDGRLASAPQATVALPDGSGPRHIAVHPGGRWYYVVAEYASEVALVRGLGTDTHALAERYPTLPADRRDAENYCSHVALSDDGRHLYVANRGDNTLAAFAVDDRTGALTPLQHVDVGGDWPRHFALSPGGDYLVVANQRSNDLAVFRRSRKTGKLSLVGSGAAPVARPMYILFR